MALVKDKVVTVESLSTLHEYNKETYIAKDNPKVEYLMIGSNIKLVPTDNSLEIVFLDEQTL